MNDDKVRTLLGFAQKAGRVVSGETGCLLAVKQKKAFLVIVSQDAAENTKNQILSLCRQKQTTCREWGLKIDLGACLGKSPRSVVALLEKGFADAIEKHLP